ncbi:hypothetical protein Esi_0166_0071 [Ectocarpus siliculosus]|uniref:Uncharacterized protein n=1 Tax=Ectocarpus siliculosus TaxID=2880 RepID=D7FMD3_ECTSI|nr:hypothetical protein Esi_0166_0071 [Ectocarpus siliculosus]|eukprot:CBJ29951.1 hypothetical protein Esi_0166_0071 [Ectocarpus siliculosus]
MRRKAEDDRRAVAQAELEQTKQASQAREKTRELEGKISALKAEGEKLTAAAAAAAASEKVAATKAVELSARLNEARARLVTGAGGGAGAAGGGAGSGGGVSGGGGLDDGMAGQLAEVGKLQMELESMRADLKAKTEALSTSERQRGQYEAMAKSKQKHVEALEAAGKATKEELEGKVNEALARAQAAEAEARSTKTGLASTVADLVKEKEMAEAEGAEKQKIVEKLKSDLRHVRSQAGQEARRTEDVRKELEVQRTAARAAEERYRQELEAHAGAITALRQAEDAQDGSDKGAREAQHGKDSLGAELIGARARWEGREGALNKGHYGGTGGRILK